MNWRWRPRWRRTLACLLVVVAILSLILSAVQRRHPMHELRGQQRNESSENEIRDLMAEAEADNHARLQRVQTVCRRHNMGLYRHSTDPLEVHEPPAPQYSVFYIDNVHKLAWCPIYKAASTTWLFHMCLLNGLTEDELTESKKQLSELARDVLPEMDFLEAEKALQQTMKLLVVRHPFARLLSAYRDKLENSVDGREHGTLHYYKRYGQRIVAKYREGGNSTKTETLLRPGQRILEKGREPPLDIEPTFEEFVRFLIDTNLEHYADDHWIPYHLYCTPCLLQYDILAKVETLHRDQIYALHSAGLLDLTQPLWLHSIGGKTNLAPIYFSQINSELLHQLYEKYKLDFELFDYTPDEYFDMVTNNERIP